MRKRESIQTSLFSKPLEFEGVKIWVVKSLPYTKKFHGIAVTHPVRYNSVGLFGSFARGEETMDSDVDILVEYDKNARISLLTISHMMGELEKSTYWKQRASRPITAMWAG